MGKMVSATEARIHLAEKLMRGLWRTGRPDHRQRGGKVHRRSARFRGV